MFINVNDRCMRFTGRWQINAESAVTTAPGSMVEIAFSGTYAVLYFDLYLSTHPYLHLWISVDGGAKIEVPLDHVIRIEAPDDGNHIIKLVYKSTMEMQHRWYWPLVGRIDFRGAEAEGTADLPKDNRKIIEFVGDSITEGVLVDPQYTFEKIGQLNRPNQDDSTATYAYLTAENLGMKPHIMGYGGTGVSKGGCGAVPKASIAYPYNFDGSPINKEKPDVIVINHGANDRETNADMYIEGYAELLTVIRKLNPDAVIVALSAFCGAYPKELKYVVKKFNEENNDNIYFIDSAGWIPEEPLHPEREGHKVVAQHLTEELRKILEGKGNE